MSFCTITPTRNERPKFRNFLEYQISRFTVKPDKSYFVDYNSVRSPDLVERVQYGVTQAMKEGFKYVFILEEDDYYKANYFENMVFNHEFDLVGSETTIYYNIVTREWENMRHNGRSSLFHTGINLDWITSFKWPIATNVFLDMALWKQAKKKRFVPSSAIGIKGHGQGLIKTRGHSMRLLNDDDEYEWLKEQTGNEFEMLMKCL